MTRNMMMERTTRREALLLLFLLQVAHFLSIAARISYLAASLQTGARKVNFLHSLTLQSFLVACYYHPHHHLAA